jgi:hypothetical protein
VYKRTEWQIEEAYKNYEQGIGDIENAARCSVSVHTIERWKRLFNWRKRRKVVRFQIAFSVPGVATASYEVTKEKEPGTRSGRNSRAVRRVAAGGTGDGGEAEREEEKTYGKIKKSVNKPQKRYSEVNAQESRNPPGNAGPPAPHFDYEARKEEPRDREPEENVRDYRRRNWPKPIEDDERFE